MSQDKNETQKDVTEEQKPAQQDEQDVEFQGEELEERIAPMKGALPGVSDVI